jgi:hypothetical protein
MQSTKISIYTERYTLVRLGLNAEFKNGRILKQLFKNANIILMMAKEELDGLWEDSESDIRKFCEANDLPKPDCDDFWEDLRTRPLLCIEKDPTALWILDISDENIKRFREYLGIWMVNTSQIKDDAFSLEHQSKIYRREECIPGSKDNGYGNFFNTMDKPFPPMNSIVLNDRFLFVVENDEIDPTKVFNWGAKNVLSLFNEVLPEKLGVPFHIFIYAFPPKIKNHDEKLKLIDELCDKIKKLRENYEIEVELVLRRAEHERFFLSNYFQITVDLGYNTFNVNSMTKLIKKNRLGIQSYLRNTSGIDYENMKIRLEDIQNEIIDERKKNKGNVFTTHETTFHNRLFPNLCN